MNDKSFNKCVTIILVAQRFKARCSAGKTLATAFCLKMKGVVPMLKKVRLHGTHWETALAVIGWLFFVGGEMFSTPVVRISCKAIARVLP
jgi:hypothetical protein